MCLSLAHQLWWNLFLAISNTLFCNVLVFSFIVCPLPFGPILLFSILSLSFIEFMFFSTCCPEKPFWESVALFFELIFFGVSFVC